MKFLKSLKKSKLRGKTALVLVDYNIPRGDNFRIRSIKPTISFLKKSRVKIILLKHLARGAKTDKFSFYTGEKRDFKKIANQLAKRADLFINDAFSVSHRRHPFITGLPKKLPSYAGLQFEHEVKNLSYALSPAHPAVVIIGGAKLETKLPMIKRFLKTADTILVGGALLNGFKIRSPKIILPNYVVRTGDWIWDVDPRSIRDWIPIIKRAKFILWNGPMGKFEDPRYKAGTLALAKAIASSHAFKIVGGGDTLAAIKKLKLGKKFNFISTGGGAMLQFLAYGTLPGIEALKKNKKRL